MDDAAERGRNRSLVVRDSGPWSTDKHWVWRMSTNVGGQITYVVYVNAKAATKDRYVKFGSNGALLHFMKQ